MYYIAADGGGNKLTAIVYDDDFNILSREVGGATNPLYRSQESISAELDSLSARLLEGIDEIEIADTCHALTFRTADNMEILLLVGIDTFMLNGEGLVPLVAEGDTVTRGQPIMEADLEKIGEAGLSPIVITVLCE